MKIFVTGGTGFVGRNIVDLLIEKGHSLKILTHRSTIKESWRDKDIEYVEGDICDPESLRGKLDGCNAVIHLVGIIVEKGSNTFERVHYEGTKNIVNEAVKAGVDRFIHMSALGTRNSPSSHYHTTKKMGETVVEDAPIAQTIFRPSIIFGKNDEFTKQLVKIVRMSPVVPTITSNKGRLQPISVKEVAHCFADCIERPETFYQSYELGGPNIYTLREMIETVAIILGKKRIFFPVSSTLMVIPASAFEWLPVTPPITRDQLRMICEDNTCDITQSQKTFNVPHITLEEGLKEIYLTDNSGNG